MAQHDFVIDDQNGLSFLADLNDVLAAIVSNNSGATEPATTYPYMFWADTTAGVLKQRNAADNAWIDVFDLTNGSPLSSNVILADGSNPMTGLLKFAAGANVASAATVDLTAATGNTVHITGTTTITAWTLSAGQVMDVVFTGALTLVHNTTSNNLPGAANISVSAGDRARLFYNGTTTYVMDYTRADGNPVRRGVELIGFLSASSSAQLVADWESASKYAALRFIFDDVRPATSGGALSFRISSDGTTFISTSTYYSSVISLTDASLAQAAQPATTSQSMMHINGARTSENGGFSGEMVLTPSISSFVLNGRYITPTDQLVQIHRTGFSTASRAIQFYMSSGNIASGKIYIYGEHLA